MPFPVARVRVRRRVPSRPPAHERAGLDVALSLPSVIQRPHGRRADAAGPRPETPSRSCHEGFSSAGAIRTNPLSATIKVKSTGRSGVTATEDDHGNRVLLAYLWSDVSGWRTAVWVPLAILEAPARRLWSVLAGLTVAAFALSLFAAALVGRSLARPIAGVASAAAALGLGDPVAYVPSAIAEVNVVGRALAAAAENRRRADAHVVFLMRELSHRTKNVMAVVQAISFQTARKSIDLEDFEQRFMDRLNALARAQDLLVKLNWKAVAIDDLVRAQLEPFLDSAQERLAVHGPSLALSPNAAQDLGLALHELATNASKYGALSVPTGKIEIGWSIDNGTAGEQRFHMTWRETGGPVVKPPVRKGFGSTVITRSLSITFNGKAEVEYRPEGLSWELAAPVGDFIAELS
jgi:two-component sensor histidine kinase